MPVGDCEKEIVSPTTADGGIAKFLEKHGPGIHHVCFEVDHIDETLVQMRSRGVILIDEVARTLPGRKMAFIHPKSANGVLVELYEVTDVS